MVRKIKAKAILRLNDQGLSGRRSPDRWGSPGRAWPRCWPPRRPRESPIRTLRRNRTTRCTRCCSPAGRTGKRVRAARLGQGPPRARACRSDPAHPARRVRRRMRRRGQASHGLRPFLQAVRRLCGEDRCDEQGRAQGRTHHRGRLGRQDHADRRSGHRRRLEGVPVRSGAAVQPVRVRGADARHGAERLAAVPRCDVRVVPRLVCDNLKTGVISHPRDGEVVLNDAYRSMAEHYSAAVIPGRVRRPKDKPSAENTVWHATMALAGAMRDRAFASLDELRGAVRGWLDEYNSRPFQKRDGSRRSVFESDERPLLIPLPGTAYEVADWIYGRKVQSNCHVAYARNWYSVPYAYAGTVVDLRVGSDTLEAWHKGPRLCTHDSCPPRRPTDTARTRPTCPGRPDGGNGTGNAASDGRNTSDRTARTSSGAVRRAALRRPGGGAALAVLRLSRRYSERRLENACSLALQSVASQGTRTSGRYSRPART